MGGEELVNPEAIIAMNAEVSPMNAAAAPIRASRGIGWTNEASQSTSTGWARSAGMTRTLAAGPMAGRTSRRSGTPSTVARLANTRTIARRTRSRRRR
jgi:hypothetical protein